MGLISSHMGLIGLVHPHTSEYLMENRASGAMMDDNQNECRNHSKPCFKMNMARSRFFFVLTILAQMFL